MFQPPTCGTAFQYECTLVEPEPSIAQFNEYVDEPVAKPKTNNRLPGEKLLKKLHKAQLKEVKRKLQFDERIEASIDSIMSDLSIHDN
jgi:hypothetical protein